MQYFVCKETRKLLSTDDIYDSGNRETSYCNKILWKNWLEDIDVLDKLDINLNFFRKWGNTIKPSNASVLK